MIRRTIKHRRNRRQLDPSNPGRPQDAIPDASSPSGSTAVIDFDVPVVVGAIPPAGDPTAITCGTTTLTGVTQVSPTQYTLTFSGAVSTNPIVIPQQSPTFRTTFGGFALAGTYPTS